MMVGVTKYEKSEPSHLGSTGWHWGVNVMWHWPTTMSQVYKKTKNPCERERRKPLMALWFTNII